jgi:hypothetical protein
MSKEFEEEVFAPHCAAHFTADGSVCGMHSQDVVGEAADDGEVFRSVILAGACVVLVEYDVENPMQLVLDAPMCAHDLGHFGRRESAMYRMAIFLLRPSVRSASIRPSALRPGSKARAAAGAGTTLALRRSMRP